MSTRYDDFIGDPPPAPAFDRGDTVRVVTSLSDFTDQEGVVSAVEDEPLGGGEWDRTFHVLFTVTMPGPLGEMEAVWVEQFREDDLERVK